MTVQTIGIAAEELLARTQSALVMGITSRGVFLRLVPEGIVFISLENYPGPLTLNLRESAVVFQDLQPGMQAQISPQQINFASSGLAFAFQNAHTWQAPPLPAGVLPPDQRKIRLEEVIRQIIAWPKTSLLSMHLPVLLKLGDAPPVLSDDTTYPMLVSLREAIHSHRLSATGEAAQVFLGLGNGLTPSGDDLITGLLLALSRWGEQLAPGFPLEALNQAILPVARRKTTLLSASLIECAARGQADERLVLALDGIVAGSASPKACAACLAGWGNTSGVDALAGMALVLVTADP